MPVQPVLSNRFRVDFEFSEFEATVLVLKGTSNLLSLNVLSIDFDTIKKTFSLNFHLPGEDLTEFLRQIDIIKSFKTVIFDNDENILHTENFNNIIKLNAEMSFNYSLGDIVELHLTGIYQ